MRIIGQVEKPVTWSAVSWQRTMIRARVYGARNPLIVYCKKEARGRIRAGAN